ATQALLKGEAKATTSTLLEMPDKLGQQALWEYDAGMCRLEAGSPDLAAEHLTKALTLAPKMTIRPVIAYYLEKLGKPVPPASPADAASTAQVAPADREPGKDDRTGEKAKADRPESPS